MRRGVVLAVVAAGGVVVAPATAVSIKDRTVLVSKSAGTSPVGSVNQAVLSGRGDVAAYVQPVADPRLPDGLRTDVIATDLRGAGRLVVSRAPDGSAANGPSSRPAISASGTRVAFVSSATNLVSNDTNDAADVFARDRAGLLVRVSIASDGTQANGPSGQPDISGDGRFVVFSSAATNLVADDTNGRIDVFVRDLRERKTTRVSVTREGANSNADSVAPAISANGGTVVFTSLADNLVPGDDNGLTDVFARPLTGRVERVSVSTSGRQQDKAVSLPFTSAADVSGDGRFVVFDTDATTLYQQDRNQRTDVYIRDRKARTTTLVSASSLNVQGNNDSVTPRITPDGRFVTFQSFASNLYPADAPGADLFVRDRLTGTTSTISATNTGARRQPEPGGLTTLQTAPIRDDGTAALFISAAANLTNASSTLGTQLYARKLAAPRLSLAVPVARKDGLVGVSMRTDDKAATRFLCRIDRAPAYYCGPIVLVPRRAGRRLTVRAGGPGLRWSAGLVVVLATR
ncbi:hypothetical protein DSM112329_03031 [Paraconexibacter sp. AEG42_29]|uniref:Uncharacterized protein n=1 Tax=Paraconexibacter sp. AEG42_29 TaxID=2997339 RepID=A0AAU7AWS7_9ACTN